MNQLLTESDTSVIADWLFNNVANVEPSIKSVPDEEIVIFTEPLFFILNNFVDDADGTVKMEDVAEPENT